MLKNNFNTQTAGTKQNNSPMARSAISLDLV